MAGKRIAIYPGSFDPPTRGHLDIIERAAALFDRLVVGVLVNPAKSPLLPRELRLRLLEEEVRERGLGHVEARSFDGLTVDFAAATGASWVVRGIRSQADLAWETAMAQTNRSSARSPLDTLLLPATSALAFIEGRLVREIARGGGDVTALVTPRVERALEEQLGPSRGSE